jgi:hypothetical protein
MGSGLYRHSWTSLPESFISAQRFSNALYFTVVWLVQINLFRPSPSHYAHENQPFLTSAYPTVHRPTGEANRFSASQEITRILRKPKVHYRINYAHHLSLSWTRSTQFHSCCCKWTWPIQAPNIPSTKYQVPSPLLRTYRRISPGRKCSCFVTKPVFTVITCQHLAQPPS